MQNPSPVIDQETQHTVSLIRPHLGEIASLVDVGCGSGWVAARLAEQTSLAISTVDIGDFRTVPTPDFHIFDGIRLPFPDKSIDAALFSFVLHHVADELKPLLIAEAKRVCRKRILVIEDTPRTWFDRFVSQRHGESFRRKIRSHERYGFLDREQWMRLFSLLGLRAIRAERLSRWCRSVWQPFARTAFVLEVVR
jgi:ubiquinone/menaquinone biosynthesis C-methylase UbiE